MPLIAGTWSFSWQGSHDVSKAGGLSSIKPPLSSCDACCWAQVAKDRARLGSMLDSRCSRQWAASSRRSNRCQHVETRLQSRQMACHHAQDAKGMLRP